MLIYDNEYKQDGQNENGLRLKTKWANLFITLCLGKFATNQIMVYFLFDN